jgi:hypothetical protein
MNFPIAYSAVNVTFKVIPFQAHFTSRERRVDASQLSKRQSENLLPGQRFMFEA